MNWTPSKLKWVLRLFFGPYVGAAIKVETISADWKYTKVCMNKRFYNNNAFGTHFGGSLFAMTDPHYVLMLTNILGRKYLVWDQSANIDFIKPAKGKVTAEFTISDELLSEIKKNTNHGQKYLPEFDVDIIDEQGVIVAKVHKTLYIRHKKQNL
jgi:acyl-coenzyme A thioesterase PaaI-like protein